MSAGYLRSPALRGSLLAFGAEDDVWLADLDDGGGGGGDGGGGGAGDGARRPARAWRLTDDRCPVRDLALSPDGAWVAWSSEVDGAPEVRVAPTAGGPARRLTWWGEPTTKVLGFSPAGAVVAASAVGQPFRSRTWAWEVPLDGGAPQRLPLGPVSGIAHAEDGSLALAIGRGGRPEYSWWKRYRGGTASRLWVRRGPAGDAGGPAGGFEPLLVDGAALPGQVVRPMWVGGRLAFLSDHEGHGNVYSCLPDGSDLRRHTDHEGPYARSASTDGRRVVYTVAGELWALDALAADSTPRRLDLAVAGPRTARAPRQLGADEVADGLDAVAVDRTGRASVVGVRGTVHRLTHRDGPSRALAVTPGVRHRLPVVLGEGAAWVSDAGGRDGLEVCGADGAVRRLADGRLGRVLDLAASPDGALLAAATHDGRVVLVDVASGADRQVATVAADAADHLVFSPDSRWLAWSAPVAGDQVSQVVMARLAPVGGADGGGGAVADEVVEVTPARFVDGEPTFTRDGRHLALLSRRTFDPVYDEHAFDLSFPRATRPYLVPLAAGTPSPFAPQLDGRPVGTVGAAGSDGVGAADGPGEGGRAPAAGGAAPGASPEQAGAEQALADGVAELVVDLDGLPSRITAVPVPADRYTSLLAVAGGSAGGLVWLRHPLSGETGDGDGGGPVAEGAAPRPVLERFDIATRRTVVLAEGVDSVAVSGDGERLVVRDGRVLRVLPAGAAASEEASGGGGDDDMALEVDLSRLRVRLDPAAEHAQMFDETLRLLRENFVDPALAGVDLGAAADRYRPALEALSTHDDLVDVLWEVQAEMGTSHAYVMPAPRGGLDERRLGFLGADLARDGDGDGAWRVTRVLPGESSDGAARSPLAAPGVRVRAGDALVSVDGVDVDPAAGPAAALAGTAGRPVELGVLGADGQRWSDVVVPLPEERSLRYQDWVAGRRAAVEAATGGRAGYLHVPDMVGSGWAQLHRDLRVEVARDALVLDVRDNSGGHTSQLVVEHLARRVLGWEVGRGWPAVTYPTNARRGPMVCVTDENAGSDGDIVTAVVKATTMASVVGTRTWGGVVGIDGRYSLVDGTSVTQPRYAFWFPGPLWSVENHGVDPDVEVVVPPAAWAAGTDPQLDRAVEVVLAALETDGADRPPDLAAYPSRVPPRLGARP